MELGPMSTPRRFWPRSIGIPSILILLSYRPLPIRVSAPIDIYVSYLTLVYSGRLVWIMRPPREKTLSVGGNALEADCVLLSPVPRCARVRNVAELPSFRHLPGPFILTTL